ncbi:MAG: response regulator transcription factor [Anaerolineae bacterium]|nr:response regulator transcription factor [Anaerolineae bacterium]
MRVLLVEPNAYWRDGYTYYLRDEGWDVDPAATVQLSEVAVRPYAAAIVDASVQSDNGQPLWQALAHSAGYPVIVLALTPAQEEALRQATLPHVRYLVKPFSLSCLSLFLRHLHVQRNVA